MNTTNKILILFGIIITLSIAYYFVISRPQLERDKFEYQKKQNQAQSIIDSLEKSTKEQNLNYCIQTARTNAYDFWNRECATRGLGDNCTLPLTNADRVDESRQTDIDNCYKLYK